MISLTRILKIVSLTLRPYFSIFGAHCDVGCSSQTAWHKRVIFLIIPGGVQISPFVLLHVGFSSFLVWWEWLSFSPSILCFSFLFFFLLSMYLLVLVPEGTTHYGVIFCGGFCKKSARLTIISSFCGSFSADVVCHYIWGDTHHE